MTVYSGVALDHHPRSNSTEIEIEQGGQVVEIAGFYPYGSDVTFPSGQIVDQAKADKLNAPSYLDRI